MSVDLNWCRDKMCFQLHSTCRLLPMTRRLLLAGCSSSGAVCGSESPLLHLLQRKAGAQKRSQVSGPYR